MSPQDRGATDRSVWLVLVYDAPPFGWGFMRAASGKCWWRRIEGRGWAVQLGRKLAEQGIHGVCRRVKHKEGRSDRGGLVPIRAALEVVRESSAWFKQYVEDFTATASQHKMNAALPEPNNPAPIKRIATSRQQEVLRRGSAGNGARKL